MFVNIVNEEESFIFKELLVNINKFVFLFKFEIKMFIYKFYR